MKLQPDRCSACDPDWPDGWCAAGRLHRGVCSACAGTEPRHRGGAPGDAAVDELRYRQSCPSGVFFTVAGREEKYKAKNLIDVVIYRGSDALYGWVFDNLKALGLKLGAIALCAVPVAAGGLVLSMILWWTQERRAAQLSEVVQGD